MAINKVVLGNQTLIDITDTTATAGTIVQGYSAYGANGVKVAGSFDPSIYVEKAGDTMTGSLNINGTNAIISEHIKHIDATQPYQYNYSEEAYTLMDTNTVKLGSIIGKLNTDGATGIGMGTSKTVEGLLHTNNLYIMMDNSGNALIEMTQPAAWRNALGLGNTSGALPIANGGTGATTKADAKTALDIDDLETTVGILNTRSSDDGTWVANSSYIGTTFTFKCYRRGIVGIIALDFNKSSTATGSDFQKVGTLPTGFLPHTSFYEQIPIQAQNAHVTIRITSGGNLDLYGNHTTTGRCRCTFAYPLNPNQY